jgi:cellulose synthase/poly-beta-1,6-N-acetylglucosamine synthase-like glycosyltransferase
VALVTNSRQILPLYRGPHMIGSRGPTVSVYIPAYNSETTIGASLDGLWSQTFEDFEVIVSEDGQGREGATAMNSCSALVDCRSTSNRRSKAKKSSAAMPA